jgi:hypothetical protein
MACIIYFSNALGITYMPPEPLTTANDSCHMSHNIVWLSGWWHENDLEDVMGQMCVGIDWVSEGGANRVSLPFHLSCERQKNTDIDLYH